MTTAETATRYAIEVWDEHDEQLISTGHLSAFAKLAVGHLRTASDLEEGVYTLHFARGGRQQVDVRLHEQPDAPWMVVKCSGDEALVPLNDRAPWR